VTKTTAVDESNNAGVWGQISQPPGVNGGSGAKPPTLRQFYSTSFQKNAFLGIF